MVGDRLPCLKIGDKYEPLDPSARSTESILEMLVTLGGARYVGDLEKKAAQWTSRIDGGGLIEVLAVMRAGRVQARFVPVRRPAPAPSGPIELDESGSFLESDTPGGRTPNASEPPPQVSVVAPLAAVAKGPPTLAGLLATAREAGASDIHIVAGRPMLLRLTGDLVPTGTTIDVQDAERCLLPVVPARLVAAFQEQGSCDFALEEPGQGRFRVNVSRQRTGYKGCFRSIAPGIPTLESLGLPAEIERATRHHQGLVLVTGPTGHGKTTTLAAIVDIINRETTHHVITVEDPVEYVHPRKSAMVSQREVGTNTRSFASALKGSLREDPDVIVVGELRDAETVRMALAASETGHLVIGTMNTPSAAKTIDRVIDLFPPADQQQVRMTLAGGLHLIIGQRLVPTADGKGVVAAVELLPGSMALWSLIRDSKTYQIPSLQQRGKGFGIMRLDESLADHVRAGRITREAALAFAENPDDLDAALRPQPAVAPAKKSDGATLLGKAGQMFGRRGP
jgi:twitching motility protein PilT